MLTQQTLDKLNAMKLGAMADAFQKQLQTAEAAALSFEERLGLLVDTASGRLASSASCNGASTRPSCAIRRRSKPSTTPIPAGSTASRS